MLFDFKIKIKNKNSLKTTPKSWLKMVFLGFSTTKLFSMFQNTLVFTMKPYYDLIAH